MKLVDYLSNGALKNILQTNGGANPPSIWIMPQPDGTYRYGFNKEANSIGGFLAPFGEVQDRKIFRAMEKDVVGFLCKFGLSKAEAESVIVTIGVEP